MEKHRTHLEKIINGKIKKWQWYESALTHPSYRNENTVAGLEDFDRLEFLGDAILNETVCHQLYRRFPEANEGLLSRLRSILVSRKILIRIFHSLKIKRFVLLGKGLKNSGHALKNAKIFADIFEALIAAVYFDAGKKKAVDFILSHYDSYFDPVRLFRLDPNPKSSLQEISLKQWKKLPEYRAKKTRQGLRVTAYIHRLKQASVLAPSRKEGEVKAARLLLQKIKNDKKIKRPNGKKRR